MVCFNQAEGTFTLSARSNWKRRITPKIINLYRLWSPLSEDDLVVVIQLNNITFTHTACNEKHQGIMFTWAEEQPQACAFQTCFLIDYYCKVDVWPFFHHIKSVEYQPSHYPHRLCFKCLCSYISQGFKWEALCLLWPSNDSKADASRKELADRLKVFISTDVLLRLRPTLLPRFVFHTGF